MKKNRFLYITSLAAAALVLRFVFVGFFTYDSFTVLIWQISRLKNYFLAAT